MLTSDQNGSSKPKTCNTGKNLAERGKATRFQKGDPRINRNGRPKSFDQVRALAQELAHEIRKDDQLTNIENVLRRWMNSPEPQLQKAFIEYAFGKVPDKVDMTTEYKTKLFLNYAHESDRRTGDRSRSTPVPSGPN